MQALVKFSLMALVLLMGSCVTAEAENKSSNTGDPETASWGVSGIPRVMTRGRFEELLAQFRDGSDQDRCTAVTAFQIHIDSCLPFVIEHLEDTEHFKGVVWQFVGGKGPLPKKYELPDKGFNMGEALEIFLISYLLKFSKEAPRRTFTKNNREGTIELWKKWYDERKDFFHWDINGFYRTR